MKRLCLFAVVGVVACAAACNSKFVNAKVVKDVHYYDETYTATPNECYYALRWALKINGYSLAKEDLPDGLLETTWIPVTADSHFIPIFNRRDYGATGSYHQLEVQVIPQGQKTKVKVGSRAKSIVQTLQSSGVEERKVLAQVGNYLRDNEPTISNEGIAKP